MNLRERAALDAQAILNDTGGAGTEFILISHEKVEYPVTGSYGDIGYLLNLATGEAVEGRTIEAAFSLASLAALTEKEPQRGWGFRVLDLAGRIVNLNVAQYEPDKTIGVGRIKLAVNLQ